MASIEDQLTQLEQDRQDLVDNLETQGISGLTGDETFTELVPEVLNISGGGGADLSEYFGTTISSGSNNSSSINQHVIKVPDNLTVQGTSLSYAFSRMSGLKSVPYMDVSGISNLSSMCQYCTNLETVSAINTSNVTNFNYTFTNCGNLKNVPVLSFSKAINATGMFANCNQLTTDSLNNILATCATSTSSFQDTKTLYTLFSADMSQYYPASTIQNLSNYQAFVTKGWSIGWN